MPRKSHEEFYVRSSLEMVWLNPGRKLLASCIAFCDSDSWRSSLQMVRLNPGRSSQSKFQETIVPRVIRVPFVPPRYQQSAKLTGRRFAALEPSGAAGWAAKVLHGTHGVRRGISVREAADRRWRSRADETLTGAPNERRNAVRDPKTPSRPSPCVAPRARVVPEP